VGSEKGKGVLTVVMSPQESQKRTMSKLKGDDFDFHKVKQVSAPSKKKVTSTLRSFSSDASGSTSCSNPLLLGLWEALKDIPPIEMNLLHRPTS
jgi:hypothetical protein